MLTETEPPSGSFVPALTAPWKRFHRVAQTGTAGAAQRPAEPRTQPGRRHDRGASHPAASSRAIRRSNSRSGARRPERLHRVMPSDGRAVGAPASTLPRCRGRQRGRDAERVGAEATNGERGGGRRGWRLRATAQSRPPWRRGTMFRQSDGQSRTLRSRRCSGPGETVRRGKRKIDPIHLPSRTAPRKSVACRERLYY